MYVQSSERSSRPGNIVSKKPWTKPICAEFDCVSSAFAVLHSMGLHQLLSFVELATAWLDALRALHEAASKTPEGRILMWTRCHRSHLYASLAQHSGTPSRNQDNTARPVTQHAVTSGKTRIKRHGASRHGISITLHHMLAEAAACFQGWRCLA